MERFTDAAQGYCEMYCKKYGHCFGDPGDCVFQDEVKMYEALKGYEFTGMTSADIRIMEANALREQEERENLKPLTLEELRQTHNPVWCSCELLDGGNGFWCLCINGKIIAPSGDSFDVEEIPNWVFLRNKPKEDT